MTISYKDVIDGKLKADKVKFNTNHIGVLASGELFNFALGGIKELDGISYVDYRWLNINLYLTTLASHTNFFELVELKDEDATLEELYDYLTNTQSKVHIDFNCIDNYEEIKKDIINTLSSYCIGKNINALTKYDSSYSDSMENLTNEMTRLQNTYTKLLEDLKNLPSMINE